jgi:membrane fusion protein (multidrug efflux system)
MSGVTLAVVAVAGLLTPSAAPAQSQEVEALKREVEALRQKIADLERKKGPAEDARKIVVTSPLAADVADAQRYIGKIQAQSHIEIRPLETGYLAEVLVEEGQPVKKGDLLFRILPALYQAKLDIELAEVQAAQIEFKATENLFKKKTVSQDELSLAQAKLSKAEAKAKLARIELGFTAVQAPFDGIIGRLQAREGSLVKEGDPLTSLSDISMLRVYFRVPEARYLEYKASLARSKEDPTAELLLASGGKLPGKGEVAAIEASGETGTIIFRTDFANPEHLLLHGQSCQVLLGRTLKNVIAIPQRSTFEMLDKRYVFVVDKDDVARQREIDVRLETDDLFVVNKGLDASDKIIVDGVRQVRDGEHVKYEFRKPEEVLPGVKKHAE